MHIKRTLAGRVFLRVLCSPKGLVSPLKMRSCIYCVISWLHYPDHWHAEMAKSVPGATETEDFQSNNETQR